MKFDNAKAKAKRRAEAEGQTEWTETERKTEREGETGRQAIPASKKLRQKKLIYLMSRGRAKAAAAEEEENREGEVESLLFPVAAGPFNVAGDMSKVFLLLSVGVAVIVVVMFVI